MNPNDETNHEPDDDLLDTFQTSARTYEMCGFAQYCRALNLADDMSIAYVTSKEVRERAIRMLAELSELVETAELRPNPKHALHLAARRDPAVRALLKQ